MRLCCGAAPGAEPVVVEIKGVRIALSICYAPRFPELFRRLAVHGGAQVLAVPAAFMLHTGRDHWEVLLRAGAVQSQCFVVAAGQLGDHDPGRTCLGRSMGPVVAQALCGYLPGRPQPRPVADDQEKTPEPGQLSALRRRGFTVRAARRARSGR